MDRGDESSRVVVLDRGLVELIQDRLALHPEGPTYALLERLSTELAKADESLPLRNVWNAGYQMGKREAEEAIANQRMPIVAVPPDPMAELAQAVLEGRVAISFRTDSDNDRIGYSIEIKPKAEET